MEKDRDAVLKLAKDIHRMVDEIEEELGQIADPEIFDEIMKIAQYGE
jgi:metal-sulfur cluster biosynthetic enzyme